MVEFFRDRKVWAAIALGCATMAPMPSRAADLLSPPPIEAVEEERVTFGTGWYLRGDLAAANDVKLSVGSVFSPTTSNGFNAWSAGLGFGYKYNNWIRTDVTADWRNSRRFEGNSTSTTCMIGMRATQVIVGFDPLGAAIYGNGPPQPINTTCYDYLRSRMSTFNLLFNGYVDLGTWAGFTPYVGAGVGASYVFQKMSRNWFMLNGNSYNVTFQDPYSTGVTYQGYWDQSRSTGSLQFAWALMAGTSYALTRNAAIDVGYRYLNIGNIKNFASLSGTTQTSLRSHELRLGLRYTPD